jgi:hypothetical protein
MTRARLPTDWRPIGTLRDEERRLAIATFKRTDKRRPIDLIEDGGDLFTVTSTSILANLADRGIANRIGRYTRRVTVGEIADDIIHARNSA